MNDYSNIFDAIREDSLKRLSQKIDQFTGRIVNTRGLEIAGEKCRTCGGAIMLDPSYEHVGPSDHPVRPMATDKRIDAYYHPEEYGGGKG